MNERIEELSLQCVRYKLIAEGARSDFDYKKFAELIVKECLNTVLVQKKWVEDMPVHNSNDEAWNRARIQQSQHIIDKIKQHFGVEE